VDPKQARQSIFPHYKGPSFTSWRDGSRENHAAPNIDRGLLFGQGSGPVENHFFCKNDFSDPGEMFCTTVLIKQAGAQNAGLFGYVTSPESALSIGFLVNYDNCVRNTIMYSGNGKLVHQVRTPNECVYSEANGNNPETKGYRHEVVSQLQVPGCHSTANTRDGKPWEMKVSIVLSGGRMWCIIDNVLYDFNFLNVQQNAEQPGISLAGQPTDLLVPLVTSPAQCLVELVTPDPTFTHVFVPETTTEKARLI